MPHADQPAVDTLGVASMSAPDTSPTVTEVLRFEDLPLGSRGTRRAIVRWSDGTEGEALTWYAELDAGTRTSRLMPRPGVMPRDPPNRFGPRRRELQTSAEVSGLAALRIAPAIADRFTAKPGCAPARPPAPRQRREPEPSRECSKQAKAEAPPGH